jgi:hypothetical protein
VLPPLPLSTRLLLQLRTVEPMAFCFAWGTRVPSRMMNSRHSSARMMAIHQHTRLRR